jgi:hypothetical protein
MAAGCDGRQRPRSPGGDPGALGLLRQQQQAVFWAALALTALVFVLKDLSIRRHLFTPECQFALNRSASLH